MNDEFWKNKKVAIAGGCSFIASHLTEALLQRDISDLWLIDDLSSGSLDNYSHLYNGKFPELFNIKIGDLRDYEFAKKSIWNADIVVDLSSYHGGRGVTGFSSNAVTMSHNLILNTNVLRACVDNGVGSYAFSSSACAYDITKQGNPDEVFRIPESWDEHNSSLYPDGMYGLTKAVHERTLKAYIDAKLINGVICRFFVVMGKRMKLNHFILAAIAKTYVKQDPYKVWGYPNVVRNFTPVENTIFGLMLAIENSFGKSNGRIYNVGLEDRITIQETLEKIWDIMNWKPREVEYLNKMPIGVYNRVADMTRAKEELGWYPVRSLDDGLKDVINWFTEKYTVDEIKQTLEKSLVSR